MVLETKVLPAELFSFFIVRYILEIKSRFVLLLITCGLILITTYFYKETLLFSILYQNIFLKNKNKQIEILYFIFTDVTEILLVYFKLIIFFNYQIIIIYLFYHFFVFTIPALFKLEYFNLQLIIKTTTTVCLVTIILCNCFILPISLEFFLSFQFKLTDTSFCLHFEAKLLEYLEFYTFFYYSCLFYSQFITLFFSFFNLINIEIRIIKKFRKLLYYFFLILATFLSPPEIIAQIGLGFISFFIYEFLIVIFLIKLSAIYLQR